MGFAFIPAALFAQESSASPQAVISLETLNVQAQTAYQAGLYAQSAALYARALALTPAVERADEEYSLACSQARAGDRAAALATLGRAVDDGYMDSNSAAADPNLSSLRGDPAWKPLLARMDALHAAQDARWGDAAFATPYAEDISDAEKLAGLSELWAQAKYGFANFWHVPDLNWDQAYREYIPKVLATKSTAEYYLVLVRFYALLEDGHTNVHFPGQIFGQYGRLPLQTRLIDGRVLVIGSRNPAADLQGIRPGDEIVSIDGVAVRRWAEQNVAPYVSASSPQDRIEKIYNNNLFAATIGTQFTLITQTPSGVQSKHLFTVVKFAPSQRPKFELKMLPDKIAYVALNEFGDDMDVKEWNSHWPEIAKARALILDLRENGGGDASVGSRILSTLINNPTPEARSQATRWIANYRAWNQGELPFQQPLGSIVPDPKRHFSGPVVWLTSPRTYSAAEDTTVVFAQSQRGKIVGEPTGGSTGQPLFFKLPGGGSARVCTRYESFADGRTFIGVGIQPDIPVHATRADIVVGRDSVLAKAVQMLQTAP